MDTTAPSTVTGAGLPWWQWDRAHQRLQQWVRTLIEHRPYRIRFATGQGSFVNFSTRDIVVEATFPSSLTPAARAMPTTWGTARVVRPTTLEVLCARALAYHEASHVLWTAVVPLHGSTHGWLVNALEDERIERLTAASYPAAGRDFLELGRRLWRDRAPHGVKPSAERSTLWLNACLFARWDAARPAHTASRLSFSDPADSARWREQIFPLVVRAWTAPDTATVAAIALEILALLGLNADDTVEHHGPAGADLIGGARGDVAGERHADDQPATAGGRMIVTGRPVEPGDDDELAGAGLDTRTADVDPSGGQLWMQPYHDLEASVLGSVRRLAAELMVATPDVAPVANNRRGRFDARACVRSRGQTPVVRETDAADDPRGLALVLLIDGTSSMGGSPGGIAPDGGPASPASFAHGRMPAVRAATMLVERACALLAVPLAIGFARDCAYPVHTGTFHRVDLSDPVVWLKRWETPVEAEGPRALIAGLYGDASSEAVSRSLQQAQRELDRRSEPVKVVLYLHDGQPEDETPDEVRATIARLRRSHGTVIIGLFLGDQRMLPAMEAIFGREFTCAVDDLQRLPARLGRILARYRQAE